VLEPEPDAPAPPAVPLTAAVPVGLAVMAEAAPVLVTPTPAQTEDPYEITEE